MSETVAEQPVEAPLSADDKFNKLLEVLAAQRSEPLDMNALRELIQGSNQTVASAMQKAMKPENTTHPGVSVFSYPEGDTKRPRPVLPYECFWNNYPIHKFPETETWYELELLCELKPGDYKVLRTDLSVMAVKVEAERNANDIITRLSVIFPVSHAEKALIPPKSVLLYQMIHAHDERGPQRRFVDAMTQYFLSLPQAA